jgi:arsenate reductase
MLRLMKKVLVLCTGNSCRSVMAEALINHCGKGRYQAVSAGSFPAGYVHPKSIQALQRHGIDVDAALGMPRSKSWDEFAGQRFDVVITVCDEAANETCFLFSGECQKLHWSTPDPAGARGSDKDIDQAFDEALHMLEARIQDELL